ncbi:hypothetical protein J1N35_044255 [Gossypium stocksii]|uniref:Uncharacterized protein n=1 Tax=Gossypium stocksii TaxID=47602 RepID=A0A9D3U8P3_9ROSI|nr:hypothetical protein J1N35_044255 [Gossypium stocksii]
MPKLPVHEPCVSGGSGKQRLPFFVQVCPFDKGDIAILEEDIVISQAMLNLGVFFESVATIVIVSPTAPSPHVSPPPPIPLTKDTFGIIVQHGPLEGLLKFRSTGGETQTLFPWREHLSMQKFPYYPTKVVLAEVGIVSMGLSKGISEEEAHELHKQLDEENRKLVDQNMRLKDHLTLSKKEIKKLHEEIKGMKADKIVLEETMKSMSEQHKLVVANLDKNHEEALKK